jgi:hypothetical protein
MRRIAFTAILLLAIPAINTQDFIYLRDGNRIKSKIKKVNYKKVLYNKYCSNDTTNYFVNKAEVLLIAYENGKVNFLKDVPEISQTFNFNKNLISYHLFDLIINEFTLSYEHLFKNGTVELQIPVSIGYGKNRNFNNLFYSGVYLNIYPTGQGKRRYFFGEELQAGVVEYDAHWHEKDENGNPQPMSKIYNRFYAKLLINNGKIKFDDHEPDNQPETAETISFNTTYRTGIKPSRA